MQKIIETNYLSLNLLKSLCKDLKILDLQAEFECYYDFIFTFHTYIKSGFYEISIVDNQHRIYHKTETVYNLIDSDTITFASIRLYRNINGLHHCDKSVNFLPTL